MKYRAVFFDFDGTLMDTSEGIFNGARYAMKKAGLPIPEDANWRTFIGPPLHDCFRITFGIEDRSVQNMLCTYYREFYKKEGFTQAVFYDGILDVVKTLRSRGVRTAITSMKNTDLVCTMCEYFGVSDLFDEKLGLNLAEDNTKADTLIQGMKIFGLEPQDCVLVGDTFVDADGAAQAGIACLRAGWGFGFERGQEGVLDRPRDVLKAVEL